MNLRVGNLSVCVTFNVKQKKQRSQLANHLFFSSGWRGGSGRLRDAAWGMICTHPWVTQHTLRYTHHLVFLSGKKSHQLSWGEGQKMVGGTLWSSFPSFYQYFVFLSWYFCSTVYLILLHLNCLTLVGKACLWNQFGLHIQALPFCLLYNKSPNFSESCFIVCNKLTWRCILQGGGESQMKSCVSTTAAVNSPLSYRTEILLWAEGCNSAGWKDFCAWFP